LLAGRCGAGRRPWRASIFDLYEEESACGGGGAGGGAIASGEDFGDGVGVEAGGGFDEGADEVADHMVEEARTGYAVDENVFLPVPG
jgi:hypothetical protein